MLVVAKVVEEDCVEDHGCDGEREGSMPVADHRNRGVLGMIKRLPYLLRVKNQGRLWSSNRFGSGVWSKTRTLRF